MTRPMCDAAVTLLLTSVGNEAIHGFWRDLKRRAPRWRLVGTDMRSDAAGLDVCDVARVVPPRRDPHYLTIVAKLCEEERVDLIVPLSTEDQDFFAASQVQAALGGRPVVVSSAAAVHVANSKIGLFDALAEMPHLLPEHQTVKGLDEAMEALARLVDKHGAALLKNDRGTGGAGMYVVGTVETDAAPALDRTFLSLDEVAAAIAAEVQASWPRQAVAWLPGEEFSVDVLARDGEVLSGVVRRRRSAVGGLALDSETVSDDGVWRAATEVIQKVGLSYVNNVQFRKDAAGVPRLMEINPRIPGTIGLTVASGLNLPLDACLLALGEAPRPSPPQIGVRVLRYRGSTVSTSAPRTHVELPGAAARAETRFTPHDDLSKRLDRVIAEATPPVVVLWDLDRTLARLDVSLEAIARWKVALEERFADVGWDGGWSPLLPSLEQALELTQRRLGAAEALRRRTTCYADLDRWEGEALNRVEPMMPALSAVQALADMDVPMAIVTNNGPIALQRSLEVIEATLGEPLGIQAAVCRGPDYAAKPSPVMLLAALERLGAHRRWPNTVVMVGDAPSDEAAIASLAGWTGIGVRFVGV